MRSSSQIRYGVILSYFAIIFNIVAGLFYTPWMISKIGKADYGLYILVSTFLAYFTVDYGLWQAVNKMVTESHTAGDQSREKSVINNATSLYLSIDLVIAIALLVVYFLLDSIYANLTPRELSTFKTLYIISSTFAILCFPFAFLKGVFMAREFFIQTNIFSLLKKVGVIIGMIIMLYLGFGVISLVVVYGATNFSLCVSEYIYLWKKGYRIRPEKFNKLILRSLFSTSIWLFILVLGEMFINNISPTVLAAFSNTIQIAIFAIGLTLFSYLNSFSSALHGFFLPKVVRYRQNNDNSSIIRLSTSVSALQMLVVGCGITGIVGIGDDFIQLWVGQDFSDSYIVACLLTIPCIVMLCQPIESTDLLASNKVKYQAFMWIGTALVSLPLSMVLSSKFGAIGCAIAISIGSIIFRCIGNNIVYKFVLRRERLPFIILLTKFTVACTLVVAIMKFLSPLLFSDLSWWILILKALLLMTLYIAATFSIAIPTDVKRQYIYPTIKKLIPYKFK